MTFAEIKAALLEELQYILIQSYDESASGGGTGSCAISTAAQTEPALLSALNQTGITNTFTTTETRTYALTGGNLTVGTTVFGISSLTANAAVRGAAGVEFISIITPTRTGRSYVPRLYPSEDGRNFEIIGYRGISDVIYSSQVVLIDDTVYPADVSPSALGDALQVVCSRAFFFQSENDEYIFAAAILRRSSNAEGWTILDENDHSPIYFTGVSGTGNQILLTYPAVSEILSFQVSLDETFSALPIKSIGASVGLSSADIYSYYYFYPFITVTKTGGVWVASSNLGTTTVTEAADYLVISHPEIETIWAYQPLGKFQVSSVRNGVSYTQQQTGIWQAGALVSPSTLPSGTRFYMKAIQPIVAPFSWNNIEEAFGNIWVMAYFKK